MDNLDALLNELHQTNVEYLKRSKKNTPSSQKNELKANRCFETEIDTVPPTTSTTHTRRPKSGTDDDPSSVNRTAVDRPHLPYTLDADLQLGEFSMARQLSRGNSHSAQPSSSARGEDADVTRQTVLEAEKAAKQLDDLLESLSQMKFDQQAELSPGRQSGGIPQSTNGVARDAGRSPTRPGRPDLSSPTDQQGAPEEEDLPQLPTRKPSLMTSQLSDLSKEVQQRGASTAPRGVCFACHKPIVGRFVSALEKYWHPEHFTCVHCGTGLVQADYYEEDDQAYCAACHRTIFSPKCAYCGEAIVEKCIVALSRAWHPEHFFCHHCHTSFTGNVTVNEHDNRIYCSVCYLNMFATRCSGCQQPITDTYITALDVPWHKQCFVCKDCGKVLAGYNFHELEGSAYCELHYHSKLGLLCATCEQPITGRCINAMGQRYHPDHFVCAYCLKPPPTGTFKEHGNKPYCHKCFSELFQ